MATARSIITRALRLLGVLGSGQELSAEDAQDALIALNEMCDYWSAEDYTTTDVITETFTLTANTPSYTIGVGQTFNTAHPMVIMAAQLIETPNNDGVLRIIPYTRYQDINDKETAAIPYFLSYLPQTSTGTIYLYPAPAEAYTLRITSRKPAFSFATLDTDVPLAPGVQAALTPNLAMWVAAEYQVPAPASVVQNAQTTLRAMRHRNSQKFDFTRTLHDIPSGAGGGLFNVNTGSFV